MKRLVLILIALAVVFPLGAAVVEPRYVGEYGNAEEPALRPYKWMWRGVKALFFQTEHGFEHGNMKMPVLGTAETFRGLRKGTLELGESAYHGVVFAPVPPKDDYKKLSSLNLKVDAEPVRSNFSDFVFSLYAFPVLKLVDTHPAERESRVEIREERSRKWREDHKKAMAEQQAAAGGKKDIGRGNLLKLAK